MRAAPTLLASLAPILIGCCARADETAPHGQFLAWTGVGIAILDRGGQELELVVKSSSIAEFSPDGEWIAYLESMPTTQRVRLTIRSLTVPDKRREVTLVWGEFGTFCYCHPHWSPNSNSILIAEKKWDRDERQEESWRLYDLHRQTFLELNLPGQYWVCDWSAGEQKLLIATRDADNPSRLAWVNIDGSGDPDYITATDVVAGPARLSPDGGRILCQIAPKGRAEKRSVLQRLFVLDLAMGNRTIIDEPGQTHGFCWSADGSRIAYTWQATLENPEQVRDRETLLITCNADGTNRTIVTRRTHSIQSNITSRSPYPKFFTVLDWR